MYKEAHKLSTRNSKMVRNKLLLELTTRQTLVVYYVYRFLKLMTGISLSLWLFCVCVSDCRRLKFYTVHVIKKKKGKKSLLTQKSILKGFLLAVLISYDIRQHLPNFKLISIHWYFYSTTALERLERVSKTKLNEQVQILLNKYFYLKFLQQRNIKPNQRSNYASIKK